MPVDLFKEKGIKIDRPRDLLKENNIKIPSNDYSPSFMQKLAPNILAGEAELGKSLINSPYNIGKYFEKNNPESKTLANMMGIKAEQIPHIPDYEYGKMLNLPQTFSDKLIQSIVKNSPSMLMPAGAATGLGRAAMSIPSQAAWGALTNKNPEKGALEFGAGQAVVESLGLPFKLIGKSAELMKPTRFANKQIENIKSGHDIAKIEMQEAYRPVQERYNDFMVSMTPDKYLGLGEKQIERLPAESKKYYDDFLSEPNFRNLHNLQSQLGKDYARYAGSKKLKTADNLKLARKSVNSKIDSFLSRDPEALTSYNEARKIARDKYYPYLSNSTLVKISEGVKKEAKPNELVNAIKKSREKIIRKENKKPITAVPEGHQLTQIQDKLKSKIKGGEALQYGIPMAAATALGGAALPGLGHVGGAGLGAMFAHYLQPGMIDFVQNPMVASTLRKYIRSPSEAAIRQGIGYNLYNEQID